MNIVGQIEATLKQEIASAVIEAGLATEEELPEVVLETPKDKAHGDYATNMAMQLARIAKKAPSQIAEDIVEHLNTEKASVQKIEIAGPGFINFFIDQSSLTGVVNTILDQGEAYGTSNTGKGQRIQIEFVSANPTGTLHLGHARGAAFGDGLANVMEKAGYNIEREYYINDAGNQIDNLAQSINARYFQAIGQDIDMPEDGYRGQDIIDLAQSLVDEHGERFAELVQEQRLSEFRQYGLKHLLDRIEKDLENYRVPFDSWFSETSLYDKGLVDDAVQKLKDKGYVYEADGATWFKSTAFGDDKDRVLVKQDGTFTYLTPDIAYHQNKIERGFDELINIWGADHHGYMARMHAAIQALGYPKDILDIKIAQMVSLFENGEKVKMSKRTGKAVTMKELIEEVGIDATRYFFIMRSNDAHLDFDMDLAKSQSTENPVYYVQYAHARICSMLRQAEEKGVDVGAAADTSLLQDEKEVDLLKRLGDYPQVIADAAEKRMPHRIPQYVFDLASDLHSFYNAVKVIDLEQPELTQARITLVKAVRVVIKDALGLIGVEAPEKM
ncbi:arginine--tRNA ligase [Tenuibacillus multivorans]|uniref:Arginine--tRNA ligase n=1 Tax=Tenuibacillus multivorans TaxID=237069 RepID=A0A1G9WYF8_9BACI|nr:arginine--tRNA ligase [Tenuibacillus multivorans]GEL77311.1 arginine--tRNA ligase [Tenuibacillus multivorans]SDM89216.1 arginyl-tRNA synthetase [Tenuibacillus multivorans]